MKIKLVKIALFTVCVLVIWSCKINTNKKDVNNSQTINTIHLWEIVSTDSIYFEFYFDEYQMFYFEHVHGAIISSIQDSVKYNNFIKRITCSNDLINQQKEVEKEFVYIYPNKIKIKSIKPIGDFIYRISNDIYENYSLFNSEANKRYFKYKYGAPLELDSTVIEEEIIIPR